MICAMHLTWRISLTTKNMWKMMILLPWRQRQDVVLLLEVVAEDVVLVEDMALVLAISVLPT
jgi:hypothetical protein